MTTTNETSIQIENLRVSLKELEGARLTGTFEEEYNRYDRTDFPELDEVCIYLRNDYTLNELTDMEVDYSLWSQDLEDVKLIGNGPFTADNKVFVVCCENEIVAIQIF